MEVVETGNAFQMSRTCVYCWFGEVRMS